MDEKINRVDSFQRVSLPTRMSVRDIHSLIRDVRRCESWSKLAAIDIKRRDLFGHTPIWCVDFSEIRVFLEKNEQQQTALHLIDYVASGGKGQKEETGLMLLPGTVFEILTFLEHLIRRSARPRRHVKFEEFKDEILKVTDHKSAGELILRFIGEHGEEQIDDAIAILKRSQPVVLRLQLLLESKHVKFFHRTHAHIENKLQWYPGYFDRIYKELHSKRDKLTINNYNDALNLTLCYALNESASTLASPYFVYVTRDRACMETAIHAPWMDDPITAIDPLERIPLCRDPYSVFLYYGEVEGKKNLADNLSLSCRSFVSQLKRLPEYLLAVRDSRVSGKPEDTLIEFNVQQSETHKNLSTSLQQLMLKYGSLLYRAIEQSDIQKLAIPSGEKSTALRPGEFPDRELAFGTRSLEKLTAALGLVYREVASQKTGAATFVKTVLHGESDRSTIQALVDVDTDFKSRACTLKTMIGRESVVCIVELYNENSEDFYYSAWWSSAANLSVFSDLVNYYWNTIRRPELDDPSTGTSQLLGDDDKVFETGVTMSIQTIEDGQIVNEIISEKIPDLMPLSEGNELLKGYVRTHSPSSIRLNTRAGDIWINFSTSSNTAPRMGIISHLWRPKLLAKMVAFTSKHFVTINDLENKLMEIRS